MAVALAVLGSPLPAGARAGTRAPNAARNVVILLDVSTSMDDIFADVQAAVEDFINTAHVGDYICLIAFSDTVRILASEEITGDADRERLVAAIRRQQPEGRFTDITSALRRGMQHLRRVGTRNGVAGSQYILLVTDGRHNPAREDEAPTFNDILMQYGRARPGEEWFLHYIALGEEPDERTLAFVEAAGGQTSWLRDVDRGAVAQLLAKLDLPFPIVVRDQYGDVQVEAEDGTRRPVDVGTVLAKGDTLHTGQHSYAVMHFGRFGVVGVEGDTAVEIEHAVQRPATNGFEVSLRVAKGRLISAIDRTLGNITFQVNSPQVQTVVTGTNFLADVDAVLHGTTIAVLNGKVQVQARESEQALFVPAGTMTSADALGALTNLEPVAEWMRELWATWSRTLFERQELRRMVSYFAAVQWRRHTLEIGPLRPGLPIVTRMYGYLGSVDLREVTAVVEQATYPPEVELIAELEPAPHGRDAGEVMIVFRTTVDSDWDIQYSTSYRALVRLSSPSIADDLDFVTPVTFRTLELVVDRLESEREPRFRRSVGAARRLEKGGTWLWAIPIAIGVGLLAVSVARSVRVARRHRHRRAPLPLRFLRWRTKRATPSGHLLLREKPPTVSWNLVRIDLEQLCETTGQTVVSIGRSRDNILVLPDQHLYLHHAEIHAGGSQAHPRLTLRVLGDAHVDINGRPRPAGDIPLENGVWMQFGQFAFTYHDRDHDTAVEIGLSNGAKLRGALQKWDARHRVVDVVQGHHHDAPHFQVLFSEMEYAAFGEDVAPAQSGPGEEEPRHTLRRWETRGPHAQVTLKSGRTFVGTIHAGYNADQEFFYFYPDADTEVEFMLIAHPHVDTLAVAKARPSE